MSHELRSPLNSIIGFSELIHQETFGRVDTERYRDYLNDIISSGYYLLSLVNDILDLSKIEAKKMTLTLEKIDLKHVTESALSLVRGMAHERSIIIETEIATEWPQNQPYLIADERAVKQMMVNLLSNAIKFTPRKGRVKLAAAPAENETTMISVTDTGIGMTPAQMKLALEPFGQIDSAFARRNYGTGLGLPLVKAMIELHGGAMVMSSEPNVGTTISLYYPNQEQMLSNVSA
ncbi:hypothetical protein CCP2SC5_2040001 [Azospirillaceae bacterium]